MGVNLARLKVYRLSRGFSQKKLASEIDMPYPTYSLKELGKSDFTSKEISKLVAVLNIEPNDLFNQDALF